MRKARQLRCPAVCPAITAASAPKPLDRIRNSSRATSARQRGLSGGGHASTPDGTELSKACLLFKPFKQATTRACCLIFHLKLFDIGRLGIGGPDQFLYFRQRHAQSRI